MKKYTLLFIFSLCAFWGFAQQESQYTNFMHNYLSLNPAYAGAREVPSFTALYRNQWLGFEGCKLKRLVHKNKHGYGLDGNKESVYGEECHYPHL